MQSPFEQKSDAQLWQLYQEVLAWKKKPQPQPPEAGKDKTLKANLKQNHQRYQELTLNLKQQEADLEALGKPRSLFNWTGPSTFDVKAREALIQEIKQERQQVKASYQKTQKALKTWTEKQTAFENWIQSPETQRIQAAREELNQPENLSRLNKISEGQDWYRFTQKLLNDAGKTEGQRRSLTGKVYRFETDGRSVQSHVMAKRFFRHPMQRNQGGDYSDLCNVHDRARPASNSKGGEHDSSATSTAAETISTSWDVTLIGSPPLSKPDD
ncbi:MAG: hypothetical protein HC810_00785 [Acaryochloridaceae cyanobacterium RL_2_7]|nr:hypothetical protein [Acaryochloridaceae cyanobacterium RL_2_7]